MGRAKGALREDFVLRGELRTMTVSQAYDEFPGVYRVTTEQMMTSSWLERLGRSTVEVWECPKCHLLMMLGRSSVEPRPKRKCSSCNLPLGRK
jgi:hypothetical protein